MTNLLLRKTGLAFDKNKVRCPLSEQADSAEIAVNPRLLSDDDVEGEVCLFFLIYRVELSFSMLSQCGPWLV